MLKTLRVRFTMMSMLIFAVMLSIIFGLIYYITAADLRDRSIRHMEDILDSRYKQTNRLDPGDELRMPCFTIQTTNWGGTYIIGNSYYDLSDETLVNELMTEAMSGAENIGVISSYGLRYLRRSSYFGWAVAFADITNERQILVGLVRDFALIGAISLLLFFAVSVLLSRWVARPVARAWEQQRQFVADASHELKTPLAVIMANAELMQDEGYTAEQRADFNSSILTMSHKMRELVERMLELARADNGQLKAAFEPLDLSALTEEALLPFEALFFENGLTLSADVEPNVRVSGSEMYLRQTIDILLDNAQKYSLPGEVKLSLRRGGRNRCLLCVSNPAPELSEEELKSIFKRFYRADKSRTSRGESSYGLGLAIADSVVREHKGKIWAESAEGSFKINIQLPLA